MHHRDLKLKVGNMRCNRRPDRDSASRLKSAIKQLTALNRLESPGRVKSYMRKWLNESCRMECI